MSVVTGTRHGFADPARLRGRPSSLSERVRADLRFSASPPGMVRRRRGSGGSRRFRHHAHEPAVVVPRSPFGSDVGDRPRSPASRLDGIILSNKHSVRARRMIRYLDREKFIMLRIVLSRSVHMTPCLHEDASANEVGGCISLMISTAGPCFQPCVRWL
jgi:hypothetical protein